MPEYKIGENIFDEKTILVGAEQESLSIDEYVKKYNIEIDGVPTLESKITRAPKNPQEATQSAFEIKNSITKDSDEVKEVLAEKYFNLSNMERPETDWQTRPRFSGNLSSDIYKNDLETDLKNYFATNVPFVGPDKYESYNKYRVNDPEFDILSLVSNAEIKSVLKEQQKRAVQLYIADIDNADIRKVASANLMDGVYDEMDATSVNPKTGNLWVDEYTTALTNDRETLYPDDFKDDVDEEPKTKSIYDVYRPVYGQAFSEASTEKNKRPLKTAIYKGQGKANIVLKNYLDFKINEIITVKENYKTTSAAFNNTVLTEIVPEVESLVSQIQDLNIKPTSSSQDRSKALSLYNQYESVMEEYRTSLSNQRLTAEAIDLSTEDFLSSTSKIDDTEFMAQAFMLDYSMSGGMQLSMEKGLIDMIGLGVKALDYLEEIPEALIAPAYEFDTGEEFEIEFFGNIHKDVIDYQESLQQHTQASRPLNIKWQDVKFSGPDQNFGEAANQLFANNIFSIGSALTYGGVISLGGKAVVAPATKYLTRLFFGLEGGAKLSEMEISQKNAQTNIDFYTNELKNATTEDERISILKQLEASRAEMNVSEYQKAFSSILYGGIAAYAEKFGTMSYVQKLALLNKSDIVGVTFGNALRGAGGFGYNTGIEYIEEAMTQVGHNLVDYGVLGKDVGLVDGIDAEFNMNVLFSTMAIQGPSTTSNVFNAIRSDVLTRQEINANQKRSSEFAEIAKELEVLYKGPNVQKTDLELYLQSELMRIMREAQVQDAEVFADVSNMSNENIFSLFEAQRKKRVLRKQGQSVGSAQSGQKYSKTANKKIKAIQKQIDDIDQEVAGLRNTTKINQKQKVDNLVELMPKDSKAKAEDYFYFGKYMESMSMTLGLGGSVLNVDTFEDVEALLKEKGATQEQIEEYMRGFRDRGANASFFGNDIIVVEQNVVRNIINAPTSYDKSAMAYSVFHELTHLNDSRTKLFEDIEMSGMNDAVIADVELLLEQIKETNADVYSSVLNRLNNYKSKGKEAYLRELTPILAELQDAGLIKEGRSFMVSLKLMLNEAINKYHDGKQPMYFKLNSAEDINAYISSFRKGVRDNNLIVSGTTPEGDPVFSEDTQRTPEKLIRQIKKLSKLPNFKDNPQYRKDYAELLAQYNLLALTAIKFDDRVGDIPRKNVVSALSVYLPGLITRYVSGKGKFSTFVTANIKPKDDTIYEEAKILSIRDSVKLDDPNIKDLAGDVNDTANTQETFVQKIDMFEDFSIVSTKSDNIKSKIKVKKGDTFKEVISENAGKVGEIIFDIPADKIMKGGANLALVTTYKEGMPIPAEAQSIQRVFNAGENTSKFLKTLPLLNVTRKTADVNKIGENIDVSREVYGRAIGLKGLVMDYFYEDYTDPKATSKDPKTKLEAETSPAGRSLGLSSQTPVKILKPQFRNPKPETIEKLKKDLGITPKNELNEYNRDIGQFLKGVAKTFAIGVALSGAQRKLEQAGASKSDIAKVTTAQGKAAFSEAFTEVDGLMVKNTLELEEKGIDNVLQARGQKKTYDLKTKAGRENFLKSMPTQLFPHMPKEFWIKDGIDVFTGSNKNYGVSMSEFKKDGTRNLDYSKEAAEAYNKFRNDVRELAQNTEDSVFGKPIEIKNEKGEVIQKANWNIVKNYGTIFGTKTSYRTKLAKKKIIEQWNKDIALIHKVMWERFNTAITQDETGEAVRAIGSYLKLTANDKKSWHRLGAQIAGYSLKITGDKIEFEHAMPATAAYLYLMNSILDERVDSFEVAYDLVIKNYKLIVLDKAMDKKLTKARTDRGYSLQKRMPDNWSVLNNNWWERYFNEIVFNADGVGIDPNSIVGLDGKTTFATMFNVNSSGINKALNTEVKQRQAFSEAVTNARGYNKNTKARGMSAFDFDETVGFSNNFVIATKDGEVKRIASDRWPFVGDQLVKEGWKMDFTDFNKVTDGKPGPLMQKMKNQIQKFGPENVFILTARAPESQGAIHEYLKSEGINIPLKNITGLGNSTGEAKALWMLNKFAEGYNDMYFVDDALPNVAAVKNVLEQLDIKSKVVQAKINFSEGLGTEFNKVLEEVKGIDAAKRFSAVKARKRGAGKGKFRLFIPPSHEDFVGLLYNFIGKGALGNSHRAFFEKALVRPLNTAFRELNAAKQSIANDYANLKKLNPETNKKLNNKIEKTKNDYTYADAVRVYLWNKFGYDIPGLSKSDQDLLVSIVIEDQEMRSFAEAVSTISRKDKYIKPSEVWEVGDIRTDLIQATDGVNREPFFAEFNNNVKEIFNTENLNKIEAVYGENLREALEDMIYRISTGTRRPQGTNKNVNRFLDYLQASIGGVMFFNMRSSILQQLSVVNFLNFEDNNLFAAGKAFADQKQYWKDWSMIFNSDMLKQRRGGLTMDVNYQDIASYASRSKQPVRSIIKRLLALGFTPTQISDSMAIASGGATFYRNRVNKYVKEGLSQKEAENKAFEDFQIVAESTQQSARPDMTSSQQNSVLGWFILGFQNVTSQYNRIIKKSGSDLINRRISPPYSDQKTSDMANVSRILYYGMVQNIVFYTLQTALFAAMFNDDEDDEAFLKKRGRVLNGTLDSLLRGSGVFGAIVSTLKNAAFAFLSERTKTYNPDESNVLVELLNVSPPLGIKARKIVGAEKTLNFDRKVISHMKTFDIDNPVWSAATSYTEAITTLPANRMFRKVQNLREAANTNNSNMQRLFLLFGWSKWNLGIEDPELEKIRKVAKRKKKRRSFK